jgi:hypothetical protein
VVLKFAPFAFKLALFFLGAAKEKVGQFDNYLHPAKYTPQERVEADGGMTAVRAGSGSHRYLDNYDYCVSQKANDT